MGSLGHETKSPVSCETGQSLKAEPTFATKSGFGSAYKIYQMFKQKASNFLANLRDNFPWGRYLFTIWNFRLKNKNRPESLRSDLSELPV